MAAQPVNAEFVAETGRQIASLSAFLGGFAFNYVFTQTLLATHPEIQVIR